MRRSGAGSGGLPDPLSTVPAPRGGCEMLFCPLIIALPSCTPTTSRQPAPSLRRSCRLISAGSLSQGQIPSPPQVLVWPYGRSAVMANDVWSPCGWLLPGRRVPRPCRPAPSLCAVEISHQLSAKGDDVLGADGGQHGGALGDAGHPGEQEDGRLQRSQEQPRPRKEEVACGRGVPLTRAGHRLPEVHSPG